MSSDTILARREARRRKILENSGNRLRIITGESSGIKSGSGSEVKKHISSNKEDLFTGKIQREEENNSPSPLIFEGPSLPTNLNDLFLQNITGLVEVSEKNDESISNFFSTSKRGHILYVVVAIVTRIIIETNDSYICANSLVGAFILTEVGVTSVYGWQIPDTSRLIGSFLLISGISSNKTDSFVFATSIFFNFFKDFAVLVFGFVFSELLTSSARYLI